MSETLWDQRNHYAVKKIRGKISLLRAPILAFLVDALVFLHSLAFLDRSAAEDEP
jgi:hypothetical protein